MKVSLTELRSNLYKMVDNVLETGEFLEIERKGKILKIIKAQEFSKLSMLRPHANILNGNPEDIVQMDWSVFWNKETFEN